MASAKTIEEQTNEDFSLLVLHECFAKCLGRKDGEIDMEGYIAGYIELYKFFQLLGTVFGFVASDVKSKTTILDGLRISENGENFITIERMVNYEKNNNLLNAKDYVSGCRTLLRLHRALAFIAEFLSSLTKLEDNAKTCYVCQDSYKNTLAKFHHWIIQKGALMAMHALPTKETLMLKVCGPDADKEQVKTLLVEVVESLNIVYNKTEALFEEHELLDLP